MFATFVQLLTLSQTLDQMTTLNTTLMLMFQNQAVPEGEQFWSLRGWVAYGAQICTQIN